MITSMKYITNTIIKVTTDNGNVYFTSYPAIGNIMEHIQEALDNGIVIEVKDPDPAPIDFSDVDNIEKAIKALGLVAATWSGKTPAQLKAAFKTAWNSLP